MSFGRLPAISNNPSKIQLDRPSHVISGHKNLFAFEAFAKDFGLTEVGREDDTIFFAGYGIDQYCYVARKSERTFFEGGVFKAQSEQDFKKAAAIEGAMISDLSSRPGGGKMVSLKTPAGFGFHVIWGQEDRKDVTCVPSAQAESLGPFNGSIEKRRMGVFQRFHPGPAMVHKFGHLGYTVIEWNREVLWYTDNFNFVPSDVQYAPDNEELEVITFLHLDLGERFSDHHSLFVGRNRPGEHDRLHHVSYEVEDFDTQLLGHEWLASKGYNALWGVGRHILGSQIFDYWRDTSGYTVEHYADGDLVNIHTGTRRTAAGPLAIWGPDIPKDFTADGTVPNAEGL